MNTNYLVTRSTLVFATWLVAASLLPNFAAASEQRTVVIHLDQDRALVEVHEQLYPLTGPLELPFDDLECITLLLVVPLGSDVSVIPDGKWPLELDPLYTGKLRKFDLCPSTVSQEWEFEVMAPGQPAPTLAKVVKGPRNPPPR